jgi:peptidyl-prolyl cis-trans isomerase B (cyclophilin B)
MNTRFLSYLLTIPEGRKHMRAFFFVLAITTLLSTSCTQPEAPRKDTKKKEKVEKMKKAEETITEESVEQVGVIETKFGKIVLKFFPDVAPGHVDNFKKLASEGFYNGATFHRVIPGFMIQGGCPNSKDADRSNDGTGGPGYNIDAEFNEMKHVRGTLSMARAMDPNSAGSQFFICVARQPSLDNQYTVFGEVTEGMDVVDKIVAVKRDARDNPIERVEMEKVYICDKY